MNPDAPDPTPRKRPRLPRTFRGRIGLAVLSLILLPHLYLLALRFVGPPTTLNMVLDPDRVVRDWVPLERMSPHLIHSVIGAEDSRFCSHSGIDWEATREVLDAPGGPTRGASTLSQQTAKNLFFWNGGGYARKAGEAWFALLGDPVWGKRRTLELYLNVADWGDGIYGAEAAARARFGKGASELSAREAALLAAVLPSPQKWRVDPPGPYVAERATTLQARARNVAAGGYAACVEP